MLEACNPHECLGGVTLHHHRFSAQCLPQIFPSFFPLCASPLHDSIWLQPESYGLLISIPLCSPEESHLPSQDVTVDSGSRTLGWLGHTESLLSAWGGWHNPTSNNRRLQISEVQISTLSACPKVSWLSRVLATLFYLRYLLETQD